MKDEVDAKTNNVPNIRDNIIAMRRFTSKHTKQL